MSDRPVMTCGHTANAVHKIKGGGEEPACVICCCCEVDESPPDLTGRVAVCPDCRTERPSDYGLPFFQYRGPGAMDHKCRNCGFYDVAHQGGRRHNGRVCDDFDPLTEGMAKDSFYCGCRGWD